MLWAKEVFETAEMIVKVKDPQPSKWAQLGEGQIIYIYLHVAPDPKQTEGLLNFGCTAIVYETVTNERGRLPLLSPMSEVAGRLSIQATARSLEKHNGGEGRLLGVASARVVVIDCGIIGTSAAKMAEGLHAEVSILDRSLDRLKELDDLFGGRVRMLASTSETLEGEVIHTDVVIGAVLIPGAFDPKLVSKALLSKMKAGSVLVGVAIDQGGCFETSKATTDMDPTYVIDHAVHCYVANMFGAVPETSSFALNNATLGYGLALAD